MAEKHNIVPVHSLGNKGGSNVIYYSIFLREKEKEIIIGFSGTQGIIQLVTEVLEAFPVAYKLHDVKGGKVFDYFYAHYVNGFRDDVLNKTQEITQKYPSYKLVFVGHSLGGALTIHAAADIILSGLANNTEVVIYTYGQPRVGDSKFNEAWMPKVTEFYRLVHNRDLVSHIPPCLRGLSARCSKDGIFPFYPYHAAQEIFYDKEFQAHVYWSDTDGEDMQCSNKIFKNSIDDHTHYFGIGVGQFHKNNEAESIQNI